MQKCYLQPTTSVSYTHLVNDSFANPNDNLFEINSDGSLLAVSFADGSLEVFDLTASDNGIELFDNTSGYTHIAGGFFEKYLAFSATNSSSSVFAVIDTCLLYTSFIIVIGEKRCCFII